MKSSLRHLITFTVAVLVGVTSSTQCRRYPEGPELSENIDSIQDLNIRALAGETGDIVTIEGVVVADLRCTGEVKFFLQMPASQVDGSLNSSEGIAIYTGYSSVDCTEVFSEGDFVRVTGTLSVYSNNPQLTNHNATLLSNVKTTPKRNCPSLAYGVNIVETKLPLSSTSELLSSLGMLISVRNRELFVTDTYDMWYGQISVSAGSRRYNPGMLFDPASDAFDEQQDLNDRNILVLDDVAGGSCPDFQLYYNLSTGGLRTGWKVPKKVLDATLVITYFATDGTYHLKPNAKGLELLPGSFIQEANPGYATPEEEMRSLRIREKRSDIRVAGLNMLNFFETLNERGADTDEEFALQKTKLYKVIAAMDAAVVGLEEIENSVNSTTLQLLVSDVNELYGLNLEGVYTGFIGLDEITNGIIYDTDVVEALGDFQILEFIDPVDKSRPAVAQSFSVIETGEVFTFVVVHMKSKGSACDEDDGVDENAISNEGNCGYTRLKHVQQMVDWLAEDPTGSGSDNILITGDFNAYVMERAAQAMVSAGYVNLGLRDGGENVYSYTFDGEFGTLDYMWASASMGELCDNTFEWHINSDEVWFRDYNEEYCYTGDKPAGINDDSVFRSSDHDPIVTFCDIGSKL